MSSRKQQCAHREIQTDVEVADVEGKLMAHIRITCAECGDPMEFDGVQRGLSYTEPAVSFDRQELRLPVTPKTQRSILEAKQRGNA